MTNIVLTHKCNLNCSYCFAKELLKDSTKSFTIENFIKAISFAKTGNEPRIGIVGGEPTIHPNFSKFIEIINNDNQIQNCSIFTNGIELNKFIDILNPSKFSLLINCNSPKDIGCLYDKLENNIKLLSETKKQEFALGLNIYSPFMDDSYIFDLLKITKQHHLRFSISITNEEKRNCKNILECLNKFIPIILRFYKYCIKNEIVPYFDCSTIPLCLTNLEFKKAQLEIMQLQKKYNIYNNILGNPCSLQVDILSDLTAIRSICYPYYEKVKISDFKNISTLRNYFYNDIDCYHKLLFIDEKCKKCSYRLKGQCNICPGYTINQFKELKEYVLNKKVAGTR